VEIQTETRRLRCESVIQMNLK